jgi:hypothetical protein
MRRRRNIMPCAPNRERRVGVVASTIERGRNLMLRLFRQPRRKMAPGHGAARPHGSAIFKVNSI